MNFFNLQEPVIYQLHKQQNALILKESTDWNVSSYMVGPKKEHTRL